MPDLWGTLVRLTIPDPGKDAPHRREGRERDPARGQLGRADGLCRVEWPQDMPVDTQTAMVKLLLRAQVVAGGQLVVPQAELLAINRNRSSRQRHRAHRR